MDFAELVAMAIANAQARSDLTASRARIVTPPTTPADGWSVICTTGRSSAWCRLRSSAHDRGSLPASQGAIKEQLAEIVKGLGDVSEELRAISRAFIPRSCPRAGWALRCGRWPAARRSRQT